MGAGASTAYEVSDGDKVLIGRTILQMKDAVANGTLTEAEAFDCFMESLNKEKQKAKESGVGIQLESSTETATKTAAETVTAAAETASLVDSKAAATASSNTNADVGLLSTKPSVLASTEFDDYELDDEDEVAPSLTMKVDAEMLVNTKFREKEKDGMLRARTSSELLERATNTADDNLQKIASFISDLKTGDVRQTKIDGGIRARRLTSGVSIDEASDPERSPMARRTKSVAARATIFASTEIGVRQEKQPPFPPTIMGTFSCHGFEPCQESDDGIQQKINQDRGCVAYPFNSSSKEALFLVLDGHGSEGDRVAEFVMRQIVVTLEKNPVLSSDPVAALKEAFVTTNTALMVTPIKFMTSGTTVVASYMKGNILYVANAGDSRCVIAQGAQDGHYSAKMISRDHKPDCPDEMERITQWGGFVSQSPEPGITARVWLDKEHTLIGLAMSRSIGDHAVKNVGVIPEPDVYQHELTSNDRFMLMASDGVFGAAHEREETASSIFKNVVSRVKTMMQKDPLINAVSKSEGNIVRMVGYDQLRDSISYLELLYAKGRGSRPTIVNDISVIHDFLLQNQKKFEQGFKEENFNIISFYTTLVGALMHGTHAVILTCVEITKTPNGLHRVDLENNLSEDIILKNIEVAAQSIKSGRADEFMYSSVKNAVASEAVVAIMAFTALIGFFWLIRDVIYYFFAAKNQLANYLETYATFLEMHSATLPTTSGDVPAKQRGIANKMRNIADKFKGKNDALNKRVIKDLKQESNKGLATDGGNFLM